MYYIFLQYIKQLYVAQLLSANDDTYTYDSRGNITSKTVGNTVTNFTYANMGWKDLLVSVDDTELEYDANGNVIIYGGMRVHLDLRQKPCERSRRYERVYLYL